MAILGYNTRGSSPTATSRAIGRLYVSKFTLAVSGTLTELHCLCNTIISSGAGTARLVVYAADGSGGNPGTRLYYSSLLAAQGTIGEYELAVTGISVALAAGDYWLGWVDVTQTASGNVYGEVSGGSHFGWTTGVADPPPNPFGAGDTSGTRKHSIWGVVGVGANPSGIAQKFKFGSGLSVTDEGSGVVRVDAPSAVLTLLNTVTLSSPGVFNISGISGSYKDLIVMIIGRAAAGGFDVDNLWVSLNSDSGSNYYMKATGGIEPSAATAFKAPLLPGSNAVANAFGYSVWTLPGYSSTVWNKAVQVENSGWAKAAASIVERLGGAWNSTAAITQIAATASSGGNFATGSQLRLYGRT